MTTTAASCSVATKVVNSVKMKKLELVTLGGADESSCSFNSGCAVIEVVLPRPQEICQISFVNNYTASLTVKAKINVEGNTPPVKVWKTVIRGHQLMPNPHCEAQSQSNFTLKENLFKCKLDSVVSVRFILRQPSPNWPNFSIEHLQLHTSDTTAKPSVKTSTQKPFDEEYANEVIWHVVDQNLPHPRSVSRDLHKMVLLSHNLSSLPSPPAGSLGRFHSDGSYDVSMLTYN